MARNIDEEMYTHIEFLEASFTMLLGRTVYHAIHTGIIGRYDTILIVIVIKGNLH